MENYALPGVKDRNWLRIFFGHLAVDMNSQKNFSIYKNPKVFKKFGK